MAAGLAWQHRGGEVALQVGKAGAGQMAGGMGALAMERVLQGKAAIENRQAGLTQALCQVLRADQAGERHSEYLGTGAGGRGNARG
ncbi:hypothetical protein D3C81_1937410 [compost metagenome]